MFVITFCNCNVFKTALEALASIVKKKKKNTWGKRTGKRNKTSLCAGTIIIVWIRSQKSL